MAKRDDIISFLNGYLEINRFKDYGPNGLQVYGRETVRHAALGVSASERLIITAADAGADLVICHHGLFWNNTPVIIKGALKKRLALLLERDISLAGYHLPLDAHPVVGNNALLAKALALKGLRPFAPAGGAVIGFYGSLKAPMEVKAFFSHAKETLGGERFTEYPFGKAKKIRTAGIVSGGGQGHVHDALALGLDCFITGEPSEYMQELAREEGIHFLAAGHYRTEVWGVRALARLLAKQFGITADFIDIPNET